MAQWFILLFMPETLGSLLTPFFCCCTAAAKSLQSCPTLWPHRRQPTRLCHPWNSPGNNTGVGCHFRLQCMKVKSESEVAQLCLTLHNPMDWSLPGSSVHGIFQARVLEWGAVAFSVFFCYTHLIHQHIASALPSKYEPNWSVITNLITIFLVQTAIISHPDLFF